MKKKLLALSLSLAIIGGIFTGCNKVNAAEKPEEGTLEFYQQLVEDLEIIEVYDSSELTLEMLQNRNGKIIIEKCIGMVTSPEGDGKVLNYTNPDYYYINYSGVENIREGTIVLTYFIYDPDTNYEDDILERFDYIIDHEQED